MKSLFSTNLWRIMLVQPFTLSTPHSRIRVSHFADPMGGAAGAGLPKEW